MSLRSQRGCTGAQSLWIRKQPKEARKILLLGFGRKQNKCGGRGASSTAEPGSGGKCQARYCPSSSSGREEKKPPGRWEERAFQGLKHDLPVLV